VAKAERLRKAAEFLELVQLAKHGRAAAQRSSPAASSSAWRWRAR
jgi:hypothetical protein